MSRRPWFILVAGINGAGKSTFTQSGETLASLIDEAKIDVEVINPDLVTRERFHAEPASRPPISGQRTRPRNDCVSFSPEERRASRSRPC